MAPSRVAFWLAGVFLLCVVYFPGPGGDWYQEARLDTTLALVYHGTFAIDAYQRNTQDKTYYRGHYYGITAPGQSLAGVPLAATYHLLAMHVFSPKQADELSRSGKHTSYQYFILKYLETLLTVTVPATLLLLLFFWFLGYFTPSVLNRAFLTLVLGLATDVFPYAQVLYAHVPATLLLFTGFALTYLLGEGRARGRASTWLVVRPQITAALIGASLGASVVFEYQTVLIGLCIAIYALGHLPKRSLPYLAAGALPGIVTVLACDEAIYGNPLITGYSHYSVLWKGSFQNDVAGFRWPPSWTALWGMTISPYRGILFLSPFLLLWLPGVWLLRDRRPLQLLLIAIPVLYLITIAMSPFWYGGISVGPRYLTPTLPFLCLPIIFVCDAVQSHLQRWLLWTLAACTAFNVWAQTIGGAGYPFTTEQDPLLHYSLPAILQGTVRVNLGSMITAPFGAPYSPLTLLILIWLLVSWTAFVYRQAVFAFIRHAFRSGSDQAAQSPVHERP